MLICHLSIFFDEVYIKVVGPLFELVVFLFWKIRRSLYVLDNSPFSDVSFASIFLKTIARLPIFLTLSSTEQKFSVLMKSSLSFFFTDCDFGVLSKKSSTHPRSARFSCMLSPRSFIILLFIFRSVIHFELIFVKGMRSVSLNDSVICTWMSSCSSTIC
uniref:Uncharacterized protein n=1 Tax=Rhinolophus ferrumequinum TaxID=59479 RepID=A0A671G2K5_RHIFE